jgi:suppressor for copper-sensitivity B
MMPGSGDAAAPQLLDVQRVDTSRLISDLGQSAEAVGAEFAIVLVSALLGGLILNLMPCVLPVLSVKLMGVVRGAGTEAGRTRVGFLITAAGIVAAFLLLAGVTIVAKAAGSTAGWGFQFQYPGFVISIALLYVLFASNLWGLFEVGLPSALTKRVPALGEHRLFSDFVVGLFAVALATPCSAPFLGTAVSFALMRGPSEILLVFTALGIGLALPYLAVAWLPRIAFLVPKPGPWMTVLRSALGAGLAVTALWLMSVLYAQSGAFVAAVVSLSLVGLVMVLWCRKPLYLDGARAVVPVALLTVVALAVPAIVPSTTAHENQYADGRTWHQFDPGRIPALVSKGKVVLVDVTAKWCITCHVNKELVLDRDPVATLLRREDVLAMVADWTRPSDQIAAFLTRFRRQGIPFTVVFGPGAPNGIALPELLTSERVVRAVDIAATHSTAVGNRTRVHLPSSEVRGSGG